MSNVLTVGTWNIRGFGYHPNRGHDRLIEALEWMLEQTPVPPDVLALPEARGALDNRQKAVRGILIPTLAPHLERGWYEPLMASRNLPGRRNHLHLLVVNTAVVKPQGWCDPMYVDVTYRNRGFAETVMFGHSVALCCEHWSGGEGRGEFERASERLGPWGGPKNKTLLLGDFNADSGWGAEQHHGVDWYSQCAETDTLHKLMQKGYQDAEGTWRVDTRQIDALRGRHGFVDMGEEVGNAEPTTSIGTGARLRIDRIFRSTGFPGRPSRYQVHQPPERLSDHAYVEGAYEIDDYAHAT